MTINRKLLLENLKACMPGVETGNVVLQGADAFVFHNGKIFSYNDSIAVSVPLELVGMIDESVEGAVHANEFFSVISKFSSEDIEFEIKDEKTWILNCGKAKVEMSLMDFDFEKRLNGVSPKEDDWEVISEEFTNALTSCKMVVNKTPIAGIYFDDNKAMSSDGMQINEFNFKNDKLPKFWLSDNSVTELQKINGLKYIQSQENWLHFKTESGTIFSVKTLDTTNGKFPFEKIVGLMETSQPKEDDLHGEFPTALFDAIDRANAFAIDISDHLVVRLNMSNDGIEVTSERSSGKYAEKVAWDKELTETFEPIILYVDASMMSFMSKKSLEFYLRRFTSKTGKIIPRLLFVSETSSHLMTTFKDDE